MIQRRSSFRPAPPLLLAAALLLATGSGGCEKSPPAPVLTVQLHAAPEDASMVNSVLIAGAAEAMLIDAQMTRDQGEAVVEMVRASGKRLTTVLISHAHADHMLGALPIREAFPGARFLAAPPVAAAIAENGEARRQAMAARLGDRLAASVVVPEPLGDLMLSLEGQGLRLIGMQPGEADAALVVYIPALKALVANDVIYNGVHLWLRDGRFDGWRANLEALQTIGEIETIYPGHGPPGGPELIDANRAYIDAFEAAAEASGSVEALVAAMNETYPQYRCGYCLRAAAEAYHGRRAR